MTINAANRLSGLVAVLPAIAFASSPQIYSLAWRPDGSGVAVGGYKEVRIGKNPARMYRTHGYSHEIN